MTTTADTPEATQFFHALYLTCTREDGKGYIKNHNLNFFCRLANSLMTESSLETNVEVERWTVDLKRKMRCRFVLVLNMLNSPTQFNCETPAAGFEPNAIEVHILVPNVGFCFELRETSEHNVLIANTKISASQLKMLTPIKDVLNVSDKWLDAMSLRIGIDVTEYVARAALQKDEVWFTTRHDI